MKFGLIVSSCSRIVSLKGRIAFVNSCSYINSDHHHYYRHQGSLRTMMWLLTFVPVLAAACSSSWDHSTLKAHPQGHSSCNAPLSPQSCAAAVWCSFQKSSTHHRSLCWHDHQPGNIFSCTVNNPLLYWYYFEYYTLWPFMHVPLTNATGWISSLNGS